MKRIITGVLLAVLSYGPTVRAQPAPTPEEVQQAQARWAEGKASFDAGNYEAARVAFKQAFTLFQHPFFLQNLGEAELRCGRSVEAARHLSQFIRTASSATTAQREAAKRSLKKASETLGSLIVETNSDDAEVRVDEEIIGRSPLGAMQWFVEPGAHVVSARKEGFLDGSEKVDVTVGPSKSVFVKLQRVTGGPLPETATPTSAHASDGDKTSAAAAVPPDSGTATASTGTTLAPRTMVLIGEAALTVTALGLAVYYNSKTANDISDRDGVRQQFAPFGGLGNTTCAKPTAATEPLCHSLASAESQIKTDMNYRLAFGITGGVLAAATVATYFLWPAKAQRPVALAVDLGSNRGAVWLAGRF
jgi:hypothetical protein